MNKIRGQMKVVGRKKPYSGGLEGSQGLFELANELRGHRPLVPKGVYRFKTFEESDQWWIEMITRPKK